MKRKFLIWTTVMLAIACYVSAGAAGNKTLSEDDLLKLLSGGVYNARIASLVHQRGISFVPTAHDLELLQRAGADQALLHEVVSAPRMLPQVTQQPTPPASQFHVKAQSIINGITPKKGNALNVGEASSKPSQLAVAPQRPDNHKVQMSATSDVLPIGAKITIWNWRDYAQYMPPAMIKLFEGHDFWKMPATIEITIGPTIRERMPVGYSAATEQQSGSVQVVHLPDGHNDIRDYVGGEPFPHPQEPDKGYKLLADLWFAYVPHLLVGTANNPLRTCSEDLHAYVNCERLSYVFRQVAYNTDGGASAEELKGTKYWYTEWSSVEEPEELRYTTLLILYPKDSQKEKELFVFVPSLRRWLRSSLASRCSPVAGTDYVEDDFKRVGFNGGIGSFDAKFLRHQQIIALTGDYNPLGGNFPFDYYWPVGWPRPSWGNWQLRDVDVIDVRRIPSERAGYCYGKRIMYEDSDTHYALWEEVYDKSMGFWKAALLAQRIVKDPALGGVPGSFTSTAWDFENRHLTNTSTQGVNGRDVLIDGAIPAQFTNYVAYSTPSGLTEIMR